jgi:hypothetical protein
VKVFDRVKYFEPMTSRHNLGDRKVLKHWFLDFSFDRDLLERSLDFDLLRLDDVDGELRRLLESPTDLEVRRV